MDRRDFLKAGALAGGSVGLGALGCGAALEGAASVAVPSVAELAALDMEGYLRRLDTSLGFIQSSSSLTGLFSNEAAQEARKDARFEGAEALIRGTLRSLLLAGSVADLPDAGRAHPGMQARLWASMQEMDDAVSGMNTMMTSFAPTERSDMNRALREDPTLAPRVLQALDEEGVKAGVNDKRRAHLQAVGRHAFFRLRQSTSAFIDEYGEKLQKVAARDASAEAFQRRLMAQMGEDAFWQYHARQFALAQAWQQMPGAAQGGPPLGAAPTGVSPATAVSPGRALDPAGARAQKEATAAADAAARKLKKVRHSYLILGLGGGMLGLGVILGGVSLSMIASMPDAGLFLAGQFMFTAAALAGIAGIGLLVAGAILRARA